MIIVEDIVDTGLTLAYLQDVLRARDPKTPEDGVPAEQAQPAQGRGPGGIYRIRDRRPIRRRIRSRSRGPVPASAVHRHPGTGAGLNPVAEYPNRRSSSARVRPRRAALFHLHLNAMVVSVGDEDVLELIDADAHRVHESPGVLPHSSESETETPYEGEYLDAVVAIVGDDDVTVRRIDCHVERRLQLSLPIAVSSELTPEAGV